MKHSQLGWKSARTWKKRVMEVTDKKPVHLIWRWLWAEQADHWCGETWMCFPEDDPCTDDLEDVTCEECLEVYHIYDGKRP